MGFRIALAEERNNLLPPTTLLLIEKLSRAGTEKT